MKNNSKDPGLSIRHSDEGAPVDLGVKVRAKVKARLEAIAAREERSLDYVADELLRWATDYHHGFAGLRDQVLADPVTGFSQDDYPESADPDWHKAQRDLWGDAEPEKKPTTPVRGSASSRARGSRRFTATAPSSQSVN